MSKWYTSVGTEADTVVSTRIRLARNIAGIPFPSRMNSEQLNQVNTAVRDALFSDSELKDKFRFIEMDSLSDIEAMSLAERHIISIEFAKSRNGKALLLSDDEAVSIMICEEDHIRIQVMRAGLALDEAYIEADRIDDILSRQLNFAFNRRLGYLTGCPTNLGTGLRASLMLHLPALEACGSINKLAATINKIGLTIRGTYGEGSKAVAAMYQLSNQVTLGISEQAAINNLKSIAVQTISQERSVRQSLDPDLIEDSAFRALGTLRYARILSNDEFMDLISRVRLGISMGIIKDVPLTAVSEILNNVGPACIQEAAGKLLEPAERDKLRAKSVRERL